MTKQELTGLLAMRGWRRDKWGKMQKLVVTPKQASWHRIGLYATGCDVYVRRRDDDGMPCWQPVVKVVRYNEVERLADGSIKLGDFIVKG